MALDVFERLLRLAQDVCGGRERAAVVFTAWCRAARASVAASYDSTLRYGAQTPFSDTLADHMEGGQWQADATHTSIIAAGNGSRQPVTAGLTLLYDHGQHTYQLERAIDADD